MRGIIHNSGTYTGLHFRSQRTVEASHYYGSGITQLKVLRKILNDNFSTQYRLNTEYDERKISGKELLSMCVSSS